MANASLVCVTEHCVSIFCTRVWSVGKPLFLITESSNFRISTAHAYKYKTKLQPKMKRRENKITFRRLVSSVPEKQSFAYRPYTSAKNQNAVLFCNTDKCISSKHTALFWRLSDVMMFEKRIDVWIMCCANMVIKGTQFKFRKEFRCSMYTFSYTKLLYFSWNHWMEFLQNFTWFHFQEILYNISDNGL